MAKYDTNGNVVWATSAGGTSDDTGFAIAVDAADNSYITGSFWGSATFGSFALTNGVLGDIFVTKYDPSGNMLWVRAAGGTERDRGHDIAVDIDGNSYVTGSYRGAATFGPFALTSNGFFVAKYDANGNVLWVRSNGEPLGGGGSGIRVDDAGNTYVSGTFAGTATFGPFTLTSAGRADIFVAKYDPSGNLLWAESAGGTESDFGGGITADDAGNTYVSGTFAGTATFGSFTLTSAGERDIFVAKYDGAGNVLWAESAGGTSFDSGGSIAADGAGNSYLTGSFAAEATFGSFSLTSAGGADIFVAKFAAPLPLGIPAVTTWGLMIMTLLLIIVAKVYFNRRRVAQA